MPLWRKRRSSVISEQLRTLVFTDLDGTLLDRQSYSWRGAESAMAELRRRRIPLILCTSKTRWEVQELRRRLGNRDPYIVENGGAVILPAGYFAALLPSELARRNLILRLGPGYRDLVQVLKALARDTGVSVRGFHHMSAGEVARQTGLSLAAARLARRREASEPFVFLDASPAQIRSFQRLARSRGFSVQRGGRFWHLFAGTDKGQALRMLTSLYQLSWGALTRVIALGDSHNDLSMLRQADMPILMPRAKGSYDADVTTVLPDICRVEGVGPAAWGRAVLRALVGLHANGNPARSSRREPIRASGALT